MAKLIETRNSPVPRAWRERFARWRDTGRPETAIQLIMAAAPRRKLDADAWSLHDCLAALDCLHSALPRAAARRQRINGLIRRIRAAMPKQPKPGPLYYITGRRAVSLRIRRVDGAGGTIAGEVRAIGTRPEMLTLRNYALNHWTRLPAGQEIEEAAKELAAAEKQSGDRRGPSGGAPEERTETGLVSPA